MNSPSASGRQALWIRNDNLWLHYCDQKSPPHWTPLTSFNTITITKIYDCYGIEWRSKEEGSKKNWKNCLLDKSSPPPTSPWLFFPRLILWNPLQQFLSDEMRVRQEVSRQVWGCDQWSHYPHFTRLANACHRHYHHCHCCCYRHCQIATAIAVAFAIRLSNQTQFSLTIQWKLGMYSATLVLSIWWQWTKCTV